MRFRCSSNYEMSVDQFWNEVFFDEEFNRYLYHEGLNFSRFEIIDENTADNGELTRIVKAFPNLNMPKPIRRILGENIHYFEHGHLDPVARHWTCRLEIPGIGSRLSIESDMWLVDRPGGGSIRHVDFDVNVRVLGMGRLFNRFIRSTFEQTYERAAEHTNLWFRRHTAQGG